MYTQQQWLSMTCTHNNSDYDMYTQQQWLWHVHTTTMTMTCTHNTYYAYHVLKARLIKVLTKHYYNMNNLYYF